MRLQSLGLVAAIVLVAASAGLAQDQQVGARTKAMGGSYTAFEDDPVSIWLNPGGIATQTDGGIINYQTYTLYDLKTSSSGGANTTRSQLGWSDPAFLPSYLGVTFQLGTSSATTGRPSSCAESHSAAIVPSGRAMRSSGVACPSSSAAAWLA